MATRIVTTSAHLDDVAAMADFLLPIPNGEQLAKVLEARNPVSTRAYEDETDTARFVESDGRTVMCFEVSGITIDQAEMIETEWEGVCALDEARFQQAVERALHEPIDSVIPHPGG
jgi:hypothetical protein